MSAQSLRLISMKDKKVVPISGEAVKLSSHLSGLLSADHPESEPIPVGNNISGRTLELIVRFMEHYKDTGNRPSKIQKPLPGPDLEKAGTNPFDLALVKDLNMDESQQLIAAANFLDVRQLVELCAAKLGSFIKGMTLKQLMDICQITEFTPEWEEKVRKENPWCKAIQKRATF